jgi:hypothetical protein
MQTWIRDPLAILADGAGRGVVIEGSRIVECVPAGGAPDRPPDAVFDASRHVVLPGLVNTHHHLFQTLTRAHPSAINRELFPWLTALYPIWSRLTPEDFRLAVRLGLTELLVSGCTTAADHHYLYPAGMDEAVDIAVEEAGALGIRMTVSRGSMNFSRKDGGLPPDSVVQDEQAILADCERVLTRYHDRSDGAMIQVALATVLAFFGDEAADAGKRRAGRAVRLPAAYASGGNARRGSLLRGALRMPASGALAGGRLARASAHLARPWHPFHLRGMRDAGPARGRRVPLPHLQRGARLGLLQDARIGGGGRAGGARRRRLGLR